MAPQFAMAVIAVSRVRFTGWARVSVSRLVGQPAHPLLPVGIGVLILDASPRCRGIAPKSNIKASTVLIDRKPHFPDDTENSFAAVPARDLSGHPSVSFERRPIPIAPKPQSSLSVLGGMYDRLHANRPFGMTRTAGAWAGFVKGMEAQPSLWLPSTTERLARRSLPTSFVLA